MAYHDELTGLANRRALIDHLTGGCAWRATDAVALIFLDVDRLKALNSVLGHVSGDQYLKTLAHRLTRCRAPSHLLARLGGDEFVLVLDDCADESLRRGDGREAHAVSRSNPSCSAVKRSPAASASASPSARQER